MLQGIPASPGIRIGKAYLKTKRKIDIDQRKIKDDQVEAEINRLHQALKRVKKELNDIKSHIGEVVGEDEARIFQAHLMLLSDPELVPAIEKKIKKDKINAEAAVNKIIGKYVQLFANMENDYMKGRKADLQDVGDRIIKILIGQDEEQDQIKEKVIIVASDLAPSDTAQLDKSFVQAFVTEQGSRTSHSAIMAQSLEIPAVVGVGSQLLKKCRQGDTVIVDGNEGKVLIRPDQSTSNQYREKSNQFQRQQQKLSYYKDKQALTKDKKRIEVMGNIGNLDDIDSVLEQGGEGIGLFRTEFLYMDREYLPTEAEQFQVYKKAACKMGDKPVVIRTLDIGGGKDLPYLELPHEKNPFLGYRAIRISLERPDIFKPQLKAILRASNYGNIKLMYPMISSLAELEAANEVLASACQELENEGKEYDKNLEVGIMIEIPATIMIADALAEKVDFFSIGTNDLIQYMMAVDRNNEKIADLHTPYHPALLKFTKTIIEAAHSQNIWVGMCGEAAGDELLIPFLLGIGLDKLSMSAVSILKIKDNISRWSLKETQTIAEEILNYTRISQVQQRLEQIQRGGNRKG